MKRVLNTVKKYELWEPKESFIVAVSGGPDSLCLLDLLYLLSKKYGFTLHVAHVNYRLRGVDSDLDEACVRERAAVYDLPITVLHPKKTEANNLEEKLRILRFRFFEELRVQKNATRIALGHHQDDQAETFLLRLLRGSGMSGLSAMRPKSNSLVRPLLHMTRADILRYVQERNIEYRTDQSNSDQKYLRNKVRHDLLPFLEKNYQPRIKQLLAETATLLAADDALIETLSPPQKLKKKGEVVSFSVNALLNGPEALTKRNLRAILTPYCKWQSPPQGLVDEVLKLLKSTRPKHQSLSTRGLKVERKGDRVTLLDLNH